MIFPLTILLVLSLVLHGGLSFAIDEHSRVNPSQNQWKIEDFYFQRLWETSPNVAMKFQLYRSYHQGCGDPFLSLLGIKPGPCGYIIPDYPVSCSSGIIPATYISKLPSRTEWSTCDSYPKGVEGEKDFPEEKKQWLKWRVYDLVESDLKTFITPTSNDIPPIPFESLKLQIINGVPLKEYVGR
jgi:hypothetical protein